MKLIEIRNILEGRSVNQKIEFINQYSFNDDYEKYYINFLKNFDFISSDPILSSFIIDIAYYKKINDESLNKLLFEILIKKSNYLVKLSIFDYFNHIAYSPNEQEICELWQENKNYSLLIKLEILFLNLRFYKNSIFKFHDIIKILKKTKNHLVYIRFFKGIKRINRNLYKNQITLLNKTFDKSTLNLKSVLPYYTDFRNANKV